MTTDLTSKESVDLRRSRRFSAGESVDQIAKKDGVTFETAEHSVRQGHRIEVMKIQHKIMLLKLQGQLFNEEIRQEVRSRLGTKVIDAIDSLLTGDRIEIWRDRKNGAIHTQTVYDPDVRLQGVEEFRKAVSLEEKPAVSQTVVNVEQKNVSSAGYDFESRLRSIRTKQKAAALPDELERIGDH